MSKRSLRALVSAGLLATGGAVALVLAPSAGAVDGSLALTPASGSNIVSPSVTVTGGCPANTDSVYAFINGGSSGHAFADNSELILPPTNGGFSIGSDFTIQTQLSFQDAVQEANGSTATLLGDYTVRLICADQLSNELAAFATRTVRFSSATAYAVITTTSIDLQVSPVSPVVKGTSVTLTATVSPADVTGSVAFKDGSTTIGTVALASGSAELTTSALPAGSHSLTAAYVPAAGTGAQPSTSNATAFSVSYPAPTFRPVLYGSVRVGYTDSCLAAFNDATAVSYVWLKDGAPISGATAASYLVPEAAYNHTLSCRVTASNPDNGPITATSVATKIGVGPALKATHAPYLSAAPKAGVRVYVRTGTWSPVPTAYTYQWRLDGRNISGAVGSSYVPTAAQRGHKLSCVVTAKRSAWTNGVASSASYTIG